jgi:hypothetical protein
MARLPGFESIRPPRPTRQTEYVAARIAQAVVEVLNLDDFYWTPSECSLKAWQMQQAIMAGVRMYNMVRYLHSRHGGWHGGWPGDGIDEHCRHAGRKIEAGEVQLAVREWIERYEVPTETAER